MRKSRDDRRTLHPRGVQESNTSDVKNHVSREALSKTGDRTDAGDLRQHGSRLKQGQYEFKKDSLVEVRRQMGLSQGKMADLIGVPSNTLSRWEIGTTYPDAQYLAAFYSAAKEHGVTPVFFGLRAGSRPFPYNLIVFWDFQSSGTLANWVPFTHSNIMTELTRRFSGMTPILKAFVHPSQKDAAQQLKSLGWRVTDGESEVFGYILEDARSDSGHNPEGTVFVLISIDNDFVGLIDDLAKNGVQVYVMSPQFYGTKLAEKVGQRFISWYPVSLEPPKRTMKNLPGSSGYPVMEWPRQSL
jgi:DNA-binding transcriptional regulator YiaG